MTIALDQVAANTRTGTGNPHTWNITVNAGTGLIVVMSAHGTSATDHWTGAVTVGGVAMRRANSLLAVDAAGEPGAAVMYWVEGSRVPTGSQAIVMNLASATTDDLHAYAMTYTSSGDCYLVTSGKVEGDTANPQVVLTAGGRHSVGIGVYYSGGLIAASTPVGSMTEHGPNNNAGATWSVCFGRTTTIDSSDKTIGWTAVSEDVALVAALFAELPPLPRYPYRQLLPQ